MFTLRERYLTAIFRKSHPQLHYGSLPLPPQGQAWAETHCRGSGRSLEPGPAASGTGHNPGHVDWYQVVYRRFVRHTIRSIHSVPRLKDDDRKAMLFANGDSGFMDKTERQSSSAYKHSQKSVQRPDVGVEAQFSNKKAPKTYRYNSSLAPELCWDENAERPFAEWLLNLLTEAAEKGENAVFAEPQVWEGTQEKFSSLSQCAARLRSLTQAFPELGGQGGTATDFSADAAALRA